MMVLFIKNIVSNIHPALGPYDPVANGIEPEAVCVRGCDCRFSSCSRAATIYVDGCATGPQDGSQANPYHTLTSAVANSALDDNIIMKGGNYPEDLSIMGQRSIGRQDGIPVIGMDIYNVGWTDVSVPMRNCTPPSNTNAKIYYPARGLQSTAGGPCCCICPRES